MANSRIRIGLFSAACLLFLTGCPIPQPRGKGLYQHIQEPTTKAWYHLYLPVDYVRNSGVHPDHPKVRKWPLVMTFHGMKPYDNALPQEREWEQEADTYGYIVCAPQLSTSDSFMQFPLRQEHSYVLRDKRNVLAIMNHVFTTTRADPDRVLSTSWSCGGYLAHYFPNRYPDKFCCIATRLSNFSADLMVEVTVPRYRDRVPVAVFIGDGDFPACKSESEQAVAWYKTRGFDVEGKTIDHMGHRRIPQTAAAFFARSIGIDPIRPIDAAKTLRTLQMTRYEPPAELLKKMAPRPDRFALGPDKTGGQTTNLAAGDNKTPESIQFPSRPLPSPHQSTLAYAPVGPGTGYPFDRVPEYNPYPEPVGIAKRGPRQTQASGEGATRVAEPSPNERRGSGNWLAPTDDPARAQDRAAEAGAASTRTPGGQSARPKADSKTAEAPRTDPTQDRPGVASVTGEPRSPVPDRRSPRQPRKDDAPSRPPPRDFAPVDAGPRNYSVVAFRDNLRREFPSKRAGDTRTSAAEATPPSPDRQKDTQLAMLDKERSTPAPSGHRSSLPEQEQPGSIAHWRNTAEQDRPSQQPDVQQAREAALPRRTARDTNPTRPLPTGSSASPYHAPPPRQDDRSMDKLVTINLSGDGIGRSPHWIKYGVDLPRSITQDADVLWMDNGVWLDDMPSGVKILRTPGQHEITVLVVDKDDHVYRGAANILVLAPHPKSQASAMR
ncbi:MAG: PHB depolymerase family esterase [Planctomycetota bacterium]